MQSRHRNAGSTELLSSHERIQPEQRWAPVPPRPGGAIDRSHIISLEEAEHVYQEGAERLIVGSGQSGMVKLSDEAVQYFRRKGCKVELMPTPAAIRAWNDAKGAVIGLFHITC